MAGEAVELATAYISLVPSMGGAEKSIADQLLPAAAGAGSKAGLEAGASMGTSMKGAFLKYLGPAALVAGTVAGFKGLYEVGEIFDDVSDTIRAGTGATGEALDGLVDSAKNVGKQVPAEFSAIGPVVADLNTRLGLSGDTLETVASQYLEAGRVLGETVDVEKTSAAFSAFKIEGDGVIDAMDTLFQVSQSSGVGMNELAAAVQANAPALQNLGFSFEETTALVGSLDKAGLNSTATLASMSKGLVTLAKDGEEPQAAFKRVTGEIDSMIQAGDTAAAIDLASTIFGTRGANQFVGAVQSGTLALDDLVAGAELSGDTILGVGEDTADFAEQWQLVKNNAAVALEPLGSAVFGALGDALGAVMPYLQSFGEWLADNQWVMGALAAGIVGIATAMGVAKIATIQWSATLLASPITWIVLGIMLLIAGLVLLVAKWDTVIAWLKDVLGGVVGWLAGVWDAITEGISTAWTAIAEFFTGLWDSIKLGVEAGWTAILDWISGVPQAILDFFLQWTLAGWLISNWDSIKASAIGIWTSLVDWVKGVPGMILDGLRAIGGFALQIGQWVLGIKDAAVEKFTSLVDWVKGIPGRILDALGDLSKLLWNAGSQIISGFWDGLKGKWEDVKGWVGGIGDWIADHKGPKAYDLALLVPAGGWIMEGFGGGLADGFEDNVVPVISGVGDQLRNALKDSTADADLTASRVAASVYAPAAAMAGVTSGAYAPAASGTSDADDVPRIVVEHMEVRDDTDIRSIAQELYRLQRRDERGS